jgi:hypothetical protein
MGDKEHGAKGLCQERAWVCGLEAANALASSGSLTVNDSEKIEIENSVEKRKEKMSIILPIRDDEKQFVIAQKLNKRFINSLGDNNPFNYVLGIRK